jgi:hypothetical protein
MPEFSPAMSQSSLQLNNNNSPDMSSAILELEAAMHNSSPEMLEGRTNNQQLLMSELLLRSTDSTSPQSFSSSLAMDPSQMTLLSQHDPAAIAEMMAFRSMSPANMNMMKQGFDNADFEHMFAVGGGLSMDHHHQHHPHFHHLNALPDRPQSTPVGLGALSGKMSRTAAARQQRASTSFGKIIFFMKKI